MRTILVPPRRSPDPRSRDPKSFPSRAAHFLGKLAACWLHMLSAGPDCSNASQPVFVSQRLGFLLLARLAQGEDQALGRTTRLLGDRPLASRGGRHSKDTPPPPPQGGELSAGGVSPPPLEG